jgi:hypothetical protein
VGEIRAIDDHQHVRPHGDGVRRRLANTPQDPRQRPHDPESDNGVFVGRERAPQPLRRHVGPAHALERGAATGLRANGAHQRGPKAVSRLLARDKEY